MKSLMIAIALVLTSQVSNAFERPFRIDRTASVDHGFAVAWGIPGQNLDFEALDKLTDEEIMHDFDHSSVKNFIVDVKTNQILMTIENDQMVSFTLGSFNFGNHYSVTLSRMAIQNLQWDTTAIAVYQNYKWSNDITKILLADTSAPVTKATVIDAEETMATLRTKLALSILPKNMDLFHNGSENVSEIKTDYNNDGEYNIMTLDYSIPKSMEKSLEVVIKVKMKLENSKVVPYIIDVKQRQY